MISDYSCVWLTNDTNYLFVCFIVRLHSKTVKVIIFFH